MFHIICMRFTSGIEILTDADFKVWGDSVERGVEQPRLWWWGVEQTACDHGANIIECICITFLLCKNHKTGWFVGSVISRSTLKLISGLDVKMCLVIGYAAVCRKKVLQCDFSLFYITEKKEMQSANLACWSDKGPIEKVSIGGGPFRKNREGDWANLLSICPLAMDDF